jgi:hypothetical protein
MKYMYLIFWVGILLSVLSNSVLAQTATIVDVQYNETTRVVTLKYKLEGVSADQYVAVRLYALQNGRKVIARSVKGNIGAGFYPIGTKTVTWNAFEDNIQTVDGLTYGFEIVTLPGQYRFDGQRLAAPRRVTNYLLPAGLGLGTCVFSGILYKQSMDIYRVYKTNLNPFSTEYSETSRDNHYLEANQKYILAQATVFAGGALVLGSLYRYKVFKERQKRWRKIKSWSVEPTFRSVPTTQGYWTLVPSVGVSYYFD